MVQPAVSKIDDAMYGRFLIALSLVRVRLVNCEIAVQVERLVPKDTAVRIEQDTERQESELADKYVITFKQSNGLIFEAREQPRQELARLTATHEFQYVLNATFHEPDSLEDCLVAFERYNLPLNAWPFMREFAHNMMGRMDLPTFTLPLLRPTEGEPQR